MQKPDKFLHLADAVGSLPGIGKKTAQRIAYFLLSQDQRYIDGFLQRISDARDSLTFCERCGNIAEQKECSVCANLSRNQHLVCVVATVEDLYAMEAAGAFDGIYHVLNGELSPRKNINPDDLRITQLVDRVGDEDIREVLIATNPTIEGEYTANYLKRILAVNPRVQISRLATGLPSNSNIDYADATTLASAIVNRRRI